MTDQTPNYNEQEQQEPLIPPRYLLIVAVVAFVVAIFTGLTQPEFGVVGFGALALSVLSLLAWAAFGALLFGRLRYGWRGRRAVRLTLTAMTLLVLAFFGSKYVLEMLLMRP